MTDVFRAEVREWLAAHVPATPLVPAWGSPAEHRARVLRELAP